jgi:hypothetical protein
MQVTRALDNTHNLERSLERVTKEVAAATVSASSACAGMRSLEQRHGELQQEVKGSL